VRKTEVIQLQLGSAGQVIEKRITDQPQIRGAWLGISAQMIFKRDVYATPSQPIVTSD
jgi:hypothetical protein